MEYTFEKMPAAEQIQQLFAAVNWESAQYPQALVHGIANAQSLLTVWDDTQLAGLMTAISDGSMNVFFPYLLIDPKYQGGRHRQGNGVPDAGQICPHLPEDPGV